VSTLHYNGLQIQVIRTLSYVRRAVYDGPIYLYTRHRIHVQGIFNPAATAYNVGAVAGTPITFPGANPALTDQTIRHQLMQPRGKLIYTAAGPDETGSPAIFRDGLGGRNLVILDCPPSTDPAQPDFGGSPGNNRYDCDAAFGPTPIDCTVRQISGTRTWVVEFVIEANVNECFVQYSHPPVILSHRWRMVHDVDRRGFTRRTVMGHVILRTDVMRSMKVSPDAFRTHVFHPIPDNMVRENIRVTAEPDGERLDYSFSDQEVALNLTVQGVAYIEAFARVHLRQPGSSEVTRSFGRPFLSGVQNFGNLIGAVEDAIPRLAVTMNVRVHGTPDAKRVKLRNIAWRVLAIKMPKAFQGPSQAPNIGLDGVVGVDMVNPYVDMNMTFLTGLGSQVNLLTGGSVAQQFPELWEDEMGDVGTWQTKPGRAAYAPEISRGFYAEQCIAQALQSPCRYPGLALNQDAQDLAVDLVVT
jgi:hypothetical protein